MVDDISSTANLQEQLIEIQNNVTLCYVKKERKNNNNPPERLSALWNKVKRGKKTKHPTLGNEVH